VLFAVLAGAIGDLADRLRLRLVTQALKRGDVLGRPRRADLVAGEPARAQQHAAP
jgi:hypothetical protein